MLKRRYSSYIPTDMIMLLNTKETGLKEKPTRTSIFDEIGKTSPINEKEISDSLDELSKTLQKKAYYKEAELKKKIQQIKKTDSLDKKTLFFLKESLLEIVYKIKDFEVKEEILDEYLFTLLTDSFLTTTEEEKMMNKQFKDKIQIFQFFINPSLLGIKKQHNNFAVFQHAIKGCITRDTEDREV